MSGWTYADDAFARREETHADGVRRADPRASESDPALGRVIADRYVLQSYLGKGRYGEVYMALDRTLSDPRLDQQHLVALHLLRRTVTEQPQLLQTLENTYHHPHLWSHPNVVKVRGFGADGGHFFLVTELLAGVSLRSVLDESPHELLSEEEAFAVLRGVGDALKYAHAKGVIHGDVRPEKVFITEDYAVKVLDLLPTIPRRTVPFFVEDVPELAPPDRRDDVYGLACIAYELFSGHPPYNANSPLEAANAGLTLTPIPGVSAARWNALVRGLALRRNDRTASVADLMSELGITGAERLRPAAARPADSPPGAMPPAAATAAPPSMSARRDDVPVLFDSMDDAAGTVPPGPEPVAPAVTAVTAVRPPHTVRRPTGVWADDADDDIELVPERWDRRRRPVRRTGVRFLAFLVTAAIAAVVGYTWFDEIEARSGEWLAAARAFVVDASRSRAEREPAEDAVNTPTTSESGAAENPSETAPAVQASAEATPGPGPADSTPATDPNAPEQSQAAAAGEPSAPSAVTPVQAQPPASAALDAASATADGAGAPAPSQNVEAPVVTTVEGPAPEAVAPRARPESRASSGEPQRVAAAPAAGPEIIEAATSSVTVSEAEPAAAIVVRRRGGEMGESSFAWWTSDGTARADDDYANLGARIEHFAAGEQSRTIHVPIVRDSRVEPREVFYVNVRSGERAGRGRDSAQRVEVVIVDDD